MSKPPTAAHIPAKTAPPALPNGLPDRDSVPMSVFLELYQRVTTLESRLELYEASSVTLQWFDRKQAQAFLGVKSTKLWELTTRDHLIETSQNGKLVSVASCRNYLTVNAVSQETIRLRLHAVSSRGKS